jgi:hypothetical protein
VRFVHTNGRRLAGPDGLLQERCSGMTRIPTTAGLVTTRVFDEVLTEVAMHVGSEQRPSGRLV